MEIKKLYPDLQPQAKNLIFVTLNDYKLYHLHLFESNSVNFLSWNSSIWEWWTKLYASRCFNTASGSGVNITIPFCGLYISSPAQSVLKYSWGIDWLKLTPLQLGPFSFFSPILIYLMTGTFATKGATWKDFCCHLRSAHLCNSHQLATLSIILNEFGDGFRIEKKRNSFEHSFLSWVDLYYLVVWTKKEEEKLQYMPKGFLLNFVVVNCFTITQYVLHDLNPNSFMLIQLLYL
jgi:hypothetical protein